VKHISEFIDILVDREIARVDRIMTEHAPNPKEKAVDDQLKALNEAYAILGQAKSEVACYASIQPYRTISHARDYIAAQADQLVAPIFEKEN
jgi:hypothetical protein